LRRVLRIAQQRNQGLNGGERFFLSASCLVVVLSLLSVHRVGGGEIAESQMMAQRQAMDSHPTTVVAGAMVPGPELMAVLREQQQVAQNMEWVRQQLTIIHQHKVKTVQGLKRRTGDNGAQARVNQAQAEQSQLQVQRNKEQAEQSSLQAQQNQEQAEQSRLQVSREQAERERTQVERDREQAVKDRAQAELDKMQADRDRQQADRDKEQADRDRQQAERDRQQADRERHQADLDREQATRQQSTKTTKTTTTVTTTKE